MYLSYNIYYTYCVYRYQVWRVIPKSVQQVKHVYGLQDAEPMVNTLCQTYCAFCIKCKLLILKLINTF